MRGYRAEPKRLPSFERNRLVAKPLPYPTFNERQRFVQAGADIFRQQADDAVATPLKEPVLAPCPAIRIEIGQLGRHVQHDRQLVHGIQEIVHPCADGDIHVHVVVDAHLALAVVQTVEPSGKLRQPSLPRDWRSKEERIKENYVPNLFLQRFSKALDLLATVVQDNGRTSFFHDRKHVLHF